jgi:hypothetical protein
LKTQILYGNNDVFVELPTPFVGKSNSFVRLHDRWLTQTQITLNGLVTGACANDFQELIDKQKTLLNNFSRDFQSLTIVEGGQTIYSAPYCWIDNINFDSDKYVRAVPYEISINCFQENLFSGVYGIENPSQQISWTENDDGTVNVSRSISAKGFNTNSNSNSNNALENARNYVQSKTGWNTSYFAEALPAFITYNQGVSLCAKKIKESIDRFGGSYSVDIEYSYNPLGTSSNLLKYVTDVNYSDEDGIYQVSIQGDLQACPESNLTLVRNEFKNIDLYSITNFEFQKLYPTEPNLNPEYLNEQITESSKLKVISFSKSWDTDPRPLVLFNYEITEEYNVLDDIYTLSLNGDITARNSQKVNWARVLNYYQNNVNVYNILRDFYIQQGYPYQLVKYPLSYSATEDIVNATIQINASFNDRLAPPFNFDDGEYTIEITPPLNQYVAVPVLCGDYTIIDTRSKKRGQISVNGELFKLSNDNKSEEVRNLAKSILNQYIPTPNRARVLKSDSVTRDQSSQGYRYSVNLSERFEGDLFQL